MPDTSDAADRGRIVHFLDFAREKQSIAEFLSAFDSLFLVENPNTLTSSTAFPTSVTAWILGSPFTSLRSP